MRWQVPRVRQLCAADDACADLRRMLLWQLPKQVCRLRWRGYFRRLLLLRVYTPREGPRRLPQDHKLGVFENRLVLPEKELPESLATRYLHMFIVVRVNVCGCANDRGTSATQPRATRLNATNYNPVVQSCFVIHGSTSRLEDQLCGNPEN